MALFLRNLLAAAGLGILAISPLQAVTPAERSEAYLARLLEGRVQGEPVDCLRAFRDNRIQTISYVGIIYRDGDTIYVSRVVEPRMLGRDDVPILARSGSEICYYDVGQTISRDGFTGRIQMTPFVPYTRQD